MATQNSRADCGVPSDATVCRVLTSALKLLLGGDGHLHSSLPLHLARYVLHVCDGLHRLVHRHGHGCGDGRGHSDDDVQSAVAVLAVAAAQAAVLAAALDDRC